MNLIPTTGSGTHVSGFKEGFCCCERVCRKQSMTIKGVKLSSDDVFHRASFFCLVKFLTHNFKVKLRKDCQIEKRIN